MRKCDIFFGRQVIGVSVKWKIFYIFLLTCIFVQITEAHEISMDDAHGFTQLNIDNTDGIISCWIVGSTHLADHRQGYVKTIVVQDTIDPVITCPGDTVIDCTSPTDIAGLGIATVTDNSDLDSISFSDMITPGACPIKDTILRTWTAVDSCGNTDVCVQMIVIQDTTSPIIFYMYPRHDTVSCLYDTREVPEALDCSETDLSCDKIIIPGNCPSNYTLIEIWVAIDECGNTSQLSDTTVFIDLNSPTIVCPPDTTVACSDNAGEAIVFDFCSSTDVIFEDAIISGSGTGDIEVQRSYFAIDDCGNLSSCVQIIQVIDSTGPIIDCPSDVTVYSFSPYDQPPSVGQAEVFDSCVSTSLPPGDIYYSDSITPGSCPGNFKITRLWGASDAFNNTSSCVQTISVLDTLPPHIICPGDTVIDCISPIDIASLGMASATDNFALDSISFSEVIILGNCPQNFTITRTWTAFDSCGNSDNCTQTITVQDSTPPVITCPEAITIDCDIADSLLFGFQFSDTCIAGSCVLPDSQGTVNIPNCPYLGDLRIIDGLPIGTTIEIDATLGTFNNVVISPGGSLGGEMITFEASIQMAMTGTVALAGFIRNIFVQVAGEIHTAPRTPGDSLQAFVTDMFSLQGTLFGDPDFDQIFINASTSFGFPSPGFITLTRLGPPDSDFNVESFFDIEYQITFQGAPGSVLEEFSGTTQSTDRFQAGDPCQSGLGIATASDNFALDSVCFIDSIAAGICPQNFTNVRTWTAVDSCGNTDICVQAIVIQDTSDPVITCPSDTVINCTSPTDIASLGMATASDNCALDSISFSDMITLGAYPINDTILRTWTAVDSCSNSDICIQTIIVHDTTDPVITCPGALPVELIDFSLTLHKQNQVLLSWATASEINNDYFDIEWSIDGRNFQPISRVSSKGSLGATYFTIHQYPIDGINYYRLIQYDRNGTYEILPIESILVTRAKVATDELSLYPNPAYDIIYVHGLSESSIYTIYDMKGMMIASGVTNVDLHAISLHNLDDGAYLMHISSSSNNLTRRFIKSEN